MDEEIQDVQQTTEEETVVTESSPVEEQTTQTEETVEEVTDESTQTGESAKPRRNAQSRIRELLEENKALKSGFNPVQQSPIGSGRFSDSLKGKSEVTPEDLDTAAEQYVAQTANTLVDLKLQPVLQELQQTKLKSEISNVQNKYDELNPDSDNYDAALDEKVAQMYAKYGAGVSLTDFIDEQMAFAGAKANKQTARTQEVVQTQKESEALRPGTPRQDVPFEQLSEKEMEARLGVVR